ncbi:ABC-2 type transport system ATP-binding protein [Micromonospora echinaurantiaca]|uniref:ABC-2 type transport system ATP-binding protein n=1 Tax=Micromonospora echinaurantiaca TaxID=47857 RepID=A0A1C5ILI0_9ACTN|nr:ABC-2 type transport system ATP-binding protein [Micromonospora echinaurantiaca]
MIDTERDPDDIIVLSGLTKLYEPTPRWMRVFARSHLRETVRALDGVDLVVRAGEICAVVGPNGAGKTTMFRIIVGLTTATEGRGSVLGLDVERDSEQVRQAVGWMPAEDRSLLMRATSRENLQLHGRLQGMSRKGLTKRIEHVLETVNLMPQADTVVAGMSAGMRARLRLARALLPGPRALILDEPTGPVDPIAAYGLLTLIMDLAKQERLAVLISSHRLEEIEALQSQALLLDGGKVRYSGDLDRLRREWERPELELVMATHQDALAIADGLHVQGVEARVDGGTVRCQPTGPGGVGALLTGLGPLTSSIRHLREIPMPLRDLIAQVYARGADPEGAVR